MDGTPLRQPSAAPTVPTARLVMVVVVMVMRHRWPPAASSRSVEPGKLVPALPSAKGDAVRRNRSRSTRTPEAPPPGPPRARRGSFQEAVWALVREIPPGRATSYGAVAAWLGSPRAARGVGWALSALPPDSGVPWWRVVNRNGEVSIRGAPGLDALQRTLLEAEGVSFDGRGRLDFRRFGWEGPIREWARPDE